MEANKETLEKKERGSGYTIFCVLFVCSILLLMVGIWRYGSSIYRNQGAVLQDEGKTEEGAGNPEEKGSNAEIGKGKTIVLDAGHGGRDGGKESADGILEKDVNLAITKLLAEDLENYGFKVVLTRKEDRDLADETAPNKKVQDLRRRVELIEETEPLMTVSIHQNSFPGKDVRGAQVFYYKNSTESSRLAKAIQGSIVSSIQPENTRQIKENDNYYLLCRTSGTIVIVECGFLSNPAEAAQLADCDYQKKMADAIAEGILEYCREG